MEYTARFVKTGNMKIGHTMWSWNKLAGSGVIAGCQGTCGNHCQGCYNMDDPKKSPCYVFKSYNRYGWDDSSVVKGHIRNTQVMRDNIEKAFSDIKLQLSRASKKPSAVRIHSSGELETVQEFREWIDTATIAPEVPFYIYSKNYEVLDEVLSIMDTKKIPKNFFINISIWHEEGIDIYNKWKHLDCIRAFVYDDGYDYSNVLKFDCYCPAYDKNGKLKHDLTCDKCKICFQKKAKVCGCYSH
jgi:hypothetical protein